MIFPYAGGLRPVPREVPIPGTPLVGGTPPLNPYLVTAADDGLGRKNEFNIA